LALAKLANDRHALLTVHYHIISDARSRAMFGNDLVAAYQALATGEVPSLPPVPFQYADYALWQRGLAPDGPGHRERARVAQATALGPRMWLRPFMRPGPDDGEGYLPWRLDAATAERLDDVARSEAATYFVVRLACLVPVLSALANSDTVVVGGTFSGRKRPELEGVFGPFAGLVPMILGCDWDVAFRESIRSIRSHIAEIQAHKDIPFAIDNAGTPEEEIELPVLPVRVRTAFQLPSTTVAGVAFRNDDVVLPPKPRGLCFVLDEIEEQDAGNQVVFDARIYDPALMRDFVERLGRFTETAAQRPDASIWQAIAASGVRRNLPGRRPDGRPPAPAVAPPAQPGSRPRPSG